MHILFNFWHRFPFFMCNTCGLFFHIFFVLFSNSFLLVARNDKILHNFFEFWTFRAVGVYALTAIHLRFNFWLRQSKWFFGFTKENFVILLFFFILIWLCLLLTFVISLQILTIFIIWELIIIRVPQLFKSKLKLCIVIE